MKVSIISCFESNDERVNFVYEACNSRNYDVSVISTDFSHINKTKRKDNPNNYTLIETKPYSSNLSIERIKSHIKFSKDAFEVVRKQKPDLIWLMIPANSLLKEAKQYKKENKDVKIIVDVIDMWPESLPVKFSKNILPLSIWRDLRNKNLDCADYLVSECNLYHEILKDYYFGNFKTIYWAKDNNVYNSTENLNDDKLSLCYLGSINNIIDIDEIYKLISSSDKPVNLHIVGTGERKQEMISKLETICYVEDYGLVLDEDKKEEILSKCHAGINIYKDNLYIGLTMKCIDYFKNGLPIINNIKADTWKFVNEYNVGINVDDNTTLDSEMIIDIRKNNKNVLDLYNMYFTKDSFINNCLEVIDEVLK